MSKIIHTSNNIKNNINRTIQNATRQVPMPKPKTSSSTPSSPQAGGSTNYSQVDTGGRVVKP